MKPRKLTEDQAAAKVLVVARRVQANHPDEQPMGMLIAAAATLLVAGFTDPRDRHVLYAAERMRDRLDESFADLRDRRPGGRRAAPAESVRQLEPRALNDRQLQILEDVRPTFTAALERIRGAVPDSTFNLWIAPLQLCGLADGHTLLVAVPEGIRAWCERRYSGLLRTALGDVDAAIDGVRFVTWVPTAVPTCNSQDADGMEPPAREQGGQHEHHPDPGA